MTGWTHVHPAGVVVNVMKAETAGERCRHCTRAIQPGQWAARSRMPNNSVTDRIFAVHAKCLRELLVGVPADDDDLTAGFFDLRDRIEQSGQPFPPEPSTV